MHDEDQARDQPSPPSRVETAVGRGCFAASMVGFVVLVGVMVLFVLTLIVLSGCGAAGGC
jgi:tetrahydromethanopterin S-methyltransferase subunit B